MTLDILLTELTERQAAALHLVMDQPPVFRVSGSLVRSGAPALDKFSLETLLLPHISTDHPALPSAEWGRETVIRHNEHPFVVSVFREGGSRIGAVVRPLLDTIPPLEQIGFDAVSTFQQAAEETSGLILITGPTGSGKTTTCAALVDAVNQRRAARIFTVEEEPSYLFESRQGLVTSLYVGYDAQRFEQGIQTVMKADPDVVFLGAIPSFEAMRLALVLAESGRLVICQMHADSAVEAVQQIVGSFPEPRAALLGTMARRFITAFGPRLLPRVPTGRAPAYEILPATTEVRVMIQEGRPEELPRIMKAGRHMGMRTVDDAIVKLFEAGTITVETARASLEDKDRLASAP